MDLALLREATSPLMVDVRIGAETHQIELEVYTAGADRLFTQEIYDEWQQLQALEGDDVAKGARFIVSQIIAMVKAWDLLYAGKPIALTEEEISAKVPNKILQEVFSATQKFYATADPMGAEVLPDTSAQTETPGDSLKTICH